MLYVSPNLKAILKIENTTGIVRNDGNKTTQMSDGNRLEYLHSH